MGVIYLSYFSRSIYCVLTLCRTIICIKFKVRILLYIISAWAMLLFVQQYRALLTASECGSETDGSRFFCMYITKLCDPIEPEVLVEPIELEEPIFIDDPLGPIQDDVLMYGGPGMCDNMIYPEPVMYGGPIDDLYDIELKGSEISF